VSAVRDAITAIREALKLVEDVQRVGSNLKAVAEELRQHDHRITRLEAKWETAIELARLRPNLPPRRLDDSH